MSGWGSMLTSRMLDRRRYFCLKIPALTSLCHSLSGQDRKKEGQTLRMTVACADNKNRFLVSGL